MAAIRLIIVGSNLISVRLLSRFLQTRSQFKVVALVDSIRGLQSSLQVNKVDVVVINSDLAGSSGGVFGRLREMSQQNPDLPWVILLDNSDPQFVVEAFRARASGVFSCADSNTRLLAKCVTRIAEGQIWANTAQLKLLLEALRGKAPLASSRREEPLSMLTIREESVARLVAQGMSNREIADQLGLSLHTVKNIMFRLFEKLGFSNRVELVLYAMARLNHSTFPEPTSADRLKKMVGTRRLDS
jgi:DNA-binding NarL/FixJ family response regulator